MISIPQFNPTFTPDDINSVIEYMNSGSFITEFKQSRHFEELLANYSNTKHAVLFPNGTLTIYSIIKCLKLKKKDKILVPNFTMAATAFAPIEAGNEIVLVDVEYPSLTINKEIINLALKKDPDIKVVIFVSANGREPKEGIEKIIEFCNEKDLILIEDAAQGLGSKYKNGNPVGSVSLASSISFSMPKIITTGQGGVVLTNDDFFNEKLRKYRDFGRLKSGNDIHSSIGLNFKYTDLQAVLGISQLSQMEERITKKKKMYKLYKDNINSNYIKLLPNPENTAPWFFEVETPFRKDLISYLYENGIGSRVMYPPINEQDALIEHIQEERSFPISKKIGLDGLWLPSSFHLSDDQILFITRKLNQFTP